MKVESEMNFSKIVKMIKILWKMKSWSSEYLSWRLETAYPGGWRYAIKHPFRTFNDIWNYLIWCEKMDSLDR